MNPFLINNYIAPEYFCDRETETGKILTNILNQSNTSVFAQRRSGKSALVHHVFHYAKKKKIVCIYLDIYATTELKDLAGQLAGAITKAFPKNRKIGKQLWEVIKSLRPVMRMDEFSGNPEITLELSRSIDIEQSIVQLLNFLDNQNIPIVVAFDEFQQIVNYPEKNVEALLRTAVQQMKNVHFIFSGSNQTMMNEIFNSAKRPFYASTKNIQLKRIDREKYTGFIRHHFHRNKFEIDDAAIHKILDVTHTHTYYVQRMCHEIFATGNKQICEDTVLQTLSEILTDNEQIYFQYRNLLTPTQWKTLIAFAKEQRTAQPFNKNFISKYGLGTPASVKRTIESLLQKELLYKHSDAKTTHYEVQDKFFMQWLRTAQ